MRIAHFSDLHFARSTADFPLRDLFSKRGVGWLNLRLGRRERRFVERARVIDAFLTDIAQQNLDQLVFTGDLTSVAYDDEFVEARRALAPLLERSDVLGLPGNHDRYVRPGQKQGRFEDSFEPWCRSDAPTPAEPTSRYPALRLVGDSLALIAISGARPCRLNDSSGELGEAGLAALDSLLRSEQVVGRQKVLALHYGPRLADGRPDRPSHGLRDADRLLTLARREGVAMLMHGHLHGRFVLPASDDRPQLIANAGSLTDAHHDRAYHVYTVSQDELHVEVRRYDPQAGSFSNWPKAPASGRFPLLARRAEREA